MDEDIFYNTLITSYEDGKEQRRKKWSQPKRTFTIVLHAKTQTIETRIWDFYKAREGVYDTFYFENPNDSPKTAVLSTTRAVGTTGTFSFPNFPWTSGDVVVYKNGVASGDYIVDRLNGQVTFNIGAYPEGGAEITADYHFAYLVRFRDNSLTRSLFSYKLWSQQLKIIQVF